MNYLEIAEKTAREAGVILLENLGKVKEIEFKAKNSLVTEVDKLSEEIIISNIKSSFPEHAIFAEESGRDSNTSDHVWLIDPIDGTTNYAHAYPFFSISIALEVRGEVIVGLVYDPVKDEMFTAEEGKGAFLNGEPIAVSKSDAIEHSHVCTGFMHEVEWMVEANIKHFGNFIRRARAVRRDGSAALDLCYVACGRFDGFWELGLNPWDTAAAVLILKEAGGHVCKFTGDQYSIYDKEILATNSIVQDQMMEILALKD
ncbi:MAG: inositol monophosphatase family protein [Thermodesulfobacteriota bacterium]